MKEKAKLIHPAKSVLAKLGADLKRARRRRRLSMALLAERASISRTTLMSIEQGNPSVSMGHYAMVMALLGFAPFCETLPTVFMTRRQNIRMNPERVRSLSTL